MPAMSTLSRYPHPRPAFRPFSHALRSSLRYKFSMKFQVRACPRARGRWATWPFRTHKFLLQGRGVTLKHSAGGRAALQYASRPVVEERNRRCHEISASRNWRAVSDAGVVSRRSGRTEITSGHLRCWRAAAGFLMPWRHGRSLSCSCDYMIGFVSVVMVKYEAEQ